MTTALTRFFSIFCYLDTFPKKGFTLIEVLLTMMILASLSALTFAGFSSISKGQLLKDATGQVKSNLRYIQNQAVSGVKPSGCSLELLESYRVVINSASGVLDSSVLCGEVTVALVSQTLPSNVFFRAIYLNSAQVSSLDVRFLPNGQTEFYDSGTKVTSINSVYLEVDLVWGSLQNLSNV